MIKTTDIRSCGARLAVRLAALLAICLLLAGFLVPIAAYADSPTDAIRLYTIQADINDDATVTLSYHLEWEVLESDGIGPVSWVTIGIPNSHYTELSALSNNISSIDYDGSGNVEVHFTDEYYEGTIIPFDFRITCDNMYSVNAMQDGYTVYYFTPGWFDGIAVDKLMIAWNASKADSWSGDCTQQDGYLLWVKSLPAGEQFSIQVSYQNGAFAFDESKGYSEGDDYQYYDGDDYYEKPSAIDQIGTFIGGLIPILFLFLFIRKLKKAAKAAYEKTSGFNSGETEKKVTRTKIVYFDNCPGCGAPRQENAQTCPFCGRDMIKSEEVISEETIKDEDKDALNYDKKGEYHYSSDPNTFVRVNVVHVPIIRPTAGGPRVNSRGGAPGGGGTGRGGSRGSSSRGGSSRGGGCAHSSCACACVSCACACACACAGGGRAGCSTKDFYKTNLKLKQLERKKK